MIFEDLIYKTKLFFHFVKFALKYWQTVGGLEQAKKEKMKERFIVPKLGKKNYDLIIIGCGPAGLAAAIYAARQKLDFCVISKDIGGQTNINTYPIENYLGYHYITGVELEQKFEEHLKDFNVDIKSEEIKKIAQIKNGFNIATSSSMYFTKALLVASGRVNQTLNVPGELDFQGRGVSFCAHCDGPLFKNKVVAVIGGGRSGLDSASQLVNLASKVYLVELSGEIKHLGPTMEYVKNNPKIEILTKTKPLEISGDQVVRGITVSQNGKERKMNVDAVFVNIGYKPSTEFLKGVVKMNERDEIIIDKNNHTSISGIFAAGDCTVIGEKQVSVAAGEGAQAFIAASEYLTRLKGKNKEIVAKVYGTRQESGL
ncbi:MAG: FAD-dependent oxidoreductase [Candidatus Aenigmarchaeota archaeon]|nr:FAD-dependent oxidoreductase [Candidatus Aenigmarchaeota archaeon]